MDKIENSRSEFQDFQIETTFLVHNRLGVNNHCKHSKTNALTHWGHLHRARIKKITATGSAFHKSRFGAVLISEVDFRKSVADILLRPYTRVNPSKTHALSDLQRDTTPFAHMFTQKSTEKPVFLKNPTCEHEGI